MSTYRNCCRRCSHPCHPCPPPYPPPYPQPYPQPYPPFPCCCPGADGKSAYQIAVEHGFVGTEAEWLESLKGEPGAPAPFLSSYVEAVGDSQTINTDENVIFSTDSDLLDTVGTDITLNSTGTVFTIVRAGLYHVEWSMNITNMSGNILFGLLENGLPASGMSNVQSTGNFSSGALIHVTSAELPYLVSLHNFGSLVSIINPVSAVNTAVSFRIMRFADGPTV